MTLHPSADASDLATQLGELRRLVCSMESVVVCFSGGIDSALLLVVAHQELGAQAVGLTAVSPSLPQKEREAAAQFSRQWGVRHHWVESNEMARSGYRENGPDRCFHCKTELYTIARSFQAERGLKAIVNGTNRDDLGDYRPGLIAADKAGIRSPFVELGMGKSDVRALAQALGLSIWNKPAAACLSSRLPYGVAVTKARLAQVESLENALRELGFEQVRVRYHHEVARIEVPPEHLIRLAQPGIRERVVELGKEAGFQYITLDLAGYRTGSLNELLSGRALKVLA